MSLSSCPHFFFALLSVVASQAAQDLEKAPLDQVSAGPPAPRAWSGYDQRWACELLRLEIQGAEGGYDPEGLLEAPLARATAEQQVLRAHRELHGCLVAVTRRHPLTCYLPASQELRSLLMRSLGAYPETDLGRPQERLRCTLVATEPADREVLDQAHAFLLQTDGLRCRAYEDYFQVPHPSGMGYVLVTYELLLTPATEEQRELTLPLEVQYTLPAFFQAKELTYPLYVLDDLLTSSHQAKDREALRHWLARGRGLVGVIMAGAAAQVEVGGLLVPEALAFYTRQGHDHLRQLCQALPTLGLRPLLHRQVDELLTEALVRLPHQWLLCAMSPPIVFRPPIDALPYCTSEGRVEVAEWAYEQGDLELLCACLALDPELADGQGQTPLHWMCQGGDAAHEIPWVLASVGGYRQGASAAGRRKKTPFELAYQGQGTEAMALLLGGVPAAAYDLADYFPAGQRNINLGDDFERTTLYWAVKKGDLPLAQALLEAGADPCLCEQPEEQAPLHLATTAGQPALVKLLLTHGAEAAQADRQGRTPLGLAVDKGHELVLTLLLRACEGAYKESLSPAQWQALLQQAWGHHHTGMAYLLLRHLGSPVTWEELLGACDPLPGLALADGQGATLLHHAAQAGDQEGVAYFLPRLALRELSTQHPSPYALAQAQGHQACAEQIHHHLLTTMQEACAQGDLELARACLALGLPAQLTAEGRPTPSYPLWAYAQGSPELALALLGLGSAPQAQDEEGKTLLHAVVGASDHATLRALVSTYPAELCWVHAEQASQTPWELARERRDTHALYLLRTLPQAPAWRLNDSCLGLCDAHGQTLFHHAAVAGDREVLAEGLAAWPHLLPPDEQGRRPEHLTDDQGVLAQLRQHDRDQLLAACRAGEDQVVKEALDLGVPPGAVGEEQAPGHLIAYRAGYPQIAFELLQRGANPLALDQAGEDLLLDVVARNDGATLDRLLPHLCAVVGSLNAGASTQEAWYRALDRRRTHLLYLLMHYGYLPPEVENDAQGVEADPLPAWLLLQDEAGQTPYHHAARRGKLPAVMANHLPLAVPFPSNEGGHAPLYYAEQAGHRGLVRLLRRHRQQQFEAFHQQAEIRSLYLLLKQGLRPRWARHFDVNRPDEQGMTLLHYAAQEGHQPLLSYLLSQPDIKLALPTRDGLRAYDLAEEEQVRSGLEEAGGALPDEEEALHQAWQAAGSPEDPFLLASQGESDLLYYLLSYQSAELTAVLEEERNDAGLLLEAGTTLLQAACAGGHTSTACCLIELGARGLEQGDLTSYLGQACEKGWTAHAQWLVGQGARGPGEFNLNRCLVKACEKGWTAHAQWLVEQGADLHSTAGWEEKTLLDVACANGHTQTAQWLVGQGAQRLSQHTRNSHLVKACEKGWTAHAQWLVEQGADLQATQLDGASYLEVACSGGHAATVEWLHAMGAEKLAQRELDKHLLRACQKGQERYVRCLVGLGANPQAANHLGSTPLHFACQQGSSSLARWLIEQGASLQVADNFGSTPLHFACQQGSTSLARWLIEQGAKLAASTKKEGNTPLHESCQEGRIEAVKLLVEEGVDLAVANKAGETPLHIACRYGHTRVAQWLVEQGSDLMATTPKEGATPLHMACRYGHIQTAMWCLGLGADLSAPNDFGNTPLHYASAYGHTAIVRWLVELGTSLLATNKYGDTPLHLACRYSHRLTACCLVELGADLTAKNNFLYTPLALAKRWQHNAALVRFLENRGAQR